MYHYDKVDYEGVLSLAFNATFTIESIKFNLLESKLHWNQYVGYLRISDYRNFTRPKFLKIQGTSSVLVQAVFPYFVYTIPENILICLGLYLLFKILSQHNISRYLRKFYFIKTALLQALIEGNVAYFAYVSFGHLQTSFNFSFKDKFSLVFTVVFLWFIVLFSFAYYPLVNFFLKKKAGYFLSYVYRCDSGCFFLTIKNLVRNFLRGAIFYFLHEFHEKQLIFLLVTQVVIIVLALYFQQKKHIFFSKSFFCLALSYHTLFAFLNLILYLASSWKIYEEENLKPLVLDIQSLATYFLVANTFMLVIIDFVPLKRGQKKQLKNQPLDKKISDSPITTTSKQNQKNQD